MPCSRMLTTAMDHIVTTQEAARFAVKFLMSTLTKSPLLVDRALVGSPGVRRRSKTETKVWEAKSLRSRYGTPGRAFWSMCQWSAMLGPTGWGSGMLRGPMLNRIVGQSCSRSKLGRLFQLAVRSPFWAVGMRRRSPVRWPPRQVRRR